MPARTATVTNICALPGSPLKAITKGPVSAKLNTISFTIDGTTEKARSRYADVDPVTGSWSMVLEINDDLDPTGTSWVIREPTGATWTIQLAAANAGQTVNLRDVLVADPTNPNPIVAGATVAALAAETSARTAGDAATLASAATDATTKANSAQAAATVAAATDATTKAGAAQAAAQGSSLQKTANLGDLASPSAARTALGLGSMAVAQTSGYAPVPAGGDAVGSVLTKKSDGSSAYLAREFDVRFYGAACDGTTNDSTAVAAAAAAASAAGGGIVRFPRGTTLAASVPIYTGVHYLGAGYGATTVKQPNATNAPVFITNGFAGLTGTNTTGGPYTWSVRDLTIDGNKANNPSGGNGLSIYGSNFTLAHLRIINCRGKGIYSEWTTNTVTSGGALEARLEDINVADAEDMAIKWLGPHDSMWHAVVGSNCARTTGDAIFDTTNVRASHCHPWGAYHARSWILRASCQIASSDCEGGSTSQFQILANGQSIDNCNIYNGQAGAAQSYGIELGDGSNAPANWRVANVTITECGNGSGGGAIGWTNDGGNGYLDASIFQSAGNMFVGTPNTSSGYYVRPLGSATKPAQMFVLPSTIVMQILGSLNFDGGVARLRASSTSQLTAFLNANPYFVLNALSKLVQLPTSAKLRTYSDNAFAAQTFEIDGATGFLTLGTSTGPRVVFGPATPEGAVTGPVGSLFIRTDGGAATSLYVKESGTGNTGWTAVGALAALVASSIGSPMTVGTWQAPGTFGLGTGIPSEGQERSQMMTAGRACTIDQLGVSITIAGSTGAVVRLGIRADDGTGNPGALLADGGTVDGTTTGDKSVTLGSPVTLAVGQKFHLTATVQGGATTRPTLRQNVSTSGPGGLGDASLTTAIGSALTGSASATTSGALPTNQTWSFHTTNSVRLAAHVSA